MEYSDYVVLGIISISILVGAIRGFVSEVFSLVVWAAAFLVAFQYSGVLALQLEEYIELPSVRTSLAFAGSFIGVLIVGGFFTFLIGKLVEKTGLSGTDRMLGGVFGGVRGLILVLFLMLVAGLTPVPRDQWWKQSGSIQSLMPLAEWSAELLPQYILEHLELTQDAEAAVKDNEEDALKDNEEDAVIDDPEVEVVDA